MAARRGLHANLVRAAGLQLDLQDRARAVPADRAIAEHRFLGARVRRGHDLGSWFAVDLPEKVGPGPGLGSTTRSTQAQ